jgi:hypothetical protein
MQTNHLFRAISFAGIVLFVTAQIGCTSASSQGLSSRGFDVSPVKARTSKSQPNIADAPTLNLNLSVDDAYAAIPHSRTAMDFSASNVPEADKKFLEVAFHVIDEAIRCRVSAYQRFSRGDINAQPISDMGQLIDYFQTTEAPQSLTTYQATVLQALRDQQAYFNEWLANGPEFQHGTPQTISSHDKVRSASKELQQGYSILMTNYPGESDHNKQAFFDYHCALDFL